MLTLVILKANKKNINFESCFREFMPIYVILIVPKEIRAASSFIQFSVKFFFFEFWLFWHVIKDIIYAILQSISPHSCLFLTKKSISLAYFTRQCYKRRTTCPKTFNFITINSAKVVCFWQLSKKFSENQYKICFYINIEISINNQWALRSNETTNKNMLKVNKKDKIKFILMPCCRC